MEKAYICSPLAGNKKENINNAIAYAKFVYHRCGMIPNTISDGMGDEIRKAMALNRSIHYIDDYQCKEILKVYG